jgi:recombination protein RecR
MALESAGTFHGTYHVLGGLVSPIDNVTPDQLHIKELLRRIKNDDVEEIILSTNASVEGESTALYIQQQIKEQGSDVKISRLARGLAVGVDLAYADQITLSRALEGRQTL